MKITGSQIVIGGIILYLLLRKRSAPILPPPAQVKPMPLPKQDYTATSRTTTKAMPNSGVAGEWELNCYHQVI